MNKPSDSEKFRQQYMATLKLQSDINEANLRANQLYVKTGMSPNTPLDARTTTEKVSDVVKLRVEIMADLRQIADGINSQAIVAGLNADQLVFVAQHMPEIITILKPKYKYGVPSDIFLTSFLPRYMSDMFRRRTIAAALPQTVTDAENGLDDDENSYYSLPVPELYPSRSDLSMPTVPYHSGMPDLDLSLPLKPSPPPPPPVKKEKGEGKKREEEEEEEEEDIGKPLPGGGAEEPFEGLNEEELSIAQEYYTKLNNQFPDSVREAVYATDEGRALLHRFRDQFRPSASIRELTVDQLKDATDHLLYEFIRPKFQHRLEKGSPEKKKKDKGGKPIPQMQLQLFGPPLRSKANLLAKYAVANRYLAESYNRMFQENPMNEPKQGWGIGKKKHRKVVGRGLAPVMKWTGFGRYRIDCQKLDSGILALRSPSGAIVPKYPTMRLPSGVVPILQGMLEDRQPSFDMLSKLSAEEKSFLKRLTKDAHLFASVGAGLPNNPADDEDVHEFEIMRGEILAGNDNTTLVKNFKLQILKLMSRDLLPKSEGKQLIMEMAALGH